MYYALYRKYRPRVFEDVIGQEHITTTLRREVEQGRCAHSYLFTGSRGTGKTTCAKILAKAVNCEHPVNGDPCLTCDTCKGIEDGSILDVVEIDAASNNGVDNIRDLKEEANFMPASAKMRVYIIDEAHMLSTGAFNALLKIMEEPPEHVLFILATTEVHKILPTIISRCQRFDFYRIPSQTIAEYLIKIVGLEQAQITQEAALTIAKLADGGVRDAMSLLDQCLAKSMDITMDVVREAAGLIGQDHLFDLSRFISEQKTNEVLSCISDFMMQSVEPSRLCEQLIAHYRNLMLVKSGCTALDLLSCLPEELTLYQALCTVYSLPKILYILRTLQDTLDRLGRVQNKKLEFEMCVMKCCSEKLSDDETALLSRIEKLEYQLAAGTVANVSDSQSVSSALEKHDIQAAPKDENSAAVESGIDSEQRSAIRQTGAAGVDYQHAQPVDNWQDVLQILSKSNPALCGALANSTAYLSGEFILIDFKSPLFSKIIREDNFAKESLRKAIYMQLGKAYRLGPYKPPQQGSMVKDEVSDPIRELLTQAAENGIEVIEK